MIGLTGSSSVSLETYKCKRVQQQFITQYLSKQLIETVVDKNDKSCLIILQLLGRTCSIATGLRGFVLLCRPEEDQIQFFFFP